MDLFEKVSEDIKTAMKAKDKVALDTLRNIKKFNGYKKSVQMIYSHK